MRDNKILAKAITNEISTTFINKKIGNTYYRVSVHFSNKSKESMDDKILRLARHDAENMSEIIAK